MADVCDDSGFDQRKTHHLAIHAHTPTDGPYPDSRSGKADSLRLLVKAEPWATARYVAAAEVGKHRGAVDAVPFGKGLDAHPVLGGADSVPIVSALRLRADRVTIVTHDAQMARAAASLGFEVVDPVTDDPGLAAVV